MPRRLMKVVLPEADGPATSTMRTRSRSRRDGVGDLGDLLLVEPLGDADDLGDLAGQAHAG